jgi:ribonuclease P protein component
VLADLFAGTGRQSDVNVRNTLKKNSDFRRLYAKGKSAATPYLVVYCRKNRLERNRAGYTVSTKLGHAVVRNRVRRRLREIVRLNRAAVKPGYDLVLVARSRAVDAEYRKLERAYLTACEKLGLRQEAEG